MIVGFTASQLSCQLGGAEQRVGGEVEVAAVADLEHCCRLVHPHNALILVIEVDVDGQFPAQPSLVRERLGEVKFVMSNPPTVLRSLLVT